MSKLETVKGLAASGQQLQIVQAIQQLQQSMNELQSLPEQTASSTRTALAPLQQVRQQIDQMRRELATLPEAVASETSQALSVLERLREDVREVLAAYQRVTDHQRQSLDSLTNEMANKAGDAFEKKASSLNELLGALEGKTSELATSIQKLTGTAQQIEQLPQKLTTAASMLNTSARTLQEAAQSLRPPLWKRLATVAAVAVLAGAAGSLAAATGQRVSAQLVPPSAEQQELESFRALWRKATPKERESMQKIADRPAK